MPDRMRKPSLCHRWNNWFRQGSPMNVKTLGWRGTRYSSISKLYLQIITRLNVHLQWTHLTVIITEEPQDSMGLPIWWKKYQISPMRYACQIYLPESNHEEAIFQVYSVGHSTKQFSWILPPKANVMENQRMWRFTGLVYMDKD